MTRCRFLAALAAIGCGSFPAGGPDLSAAVPVELATRNKLDLLTVIDDSGSTWDLQPAFARAMPEVFAALRDGNGKLPSLHLGVVSQNMGILPFNAGQSCAGEGEAGVLQNLPRGDCTPPMGQFIRHDGADTNYAGNLEDVFSCIAVLGSGGCGFEQPLAAMERALGGSVVENAGFLREGAWLGVIILMNEDDCSAEDPAIFDPSQDDLDDPLGPFSSFRCTEFGLMCDGAAPTRHSAEYTSCEPAPDTATNYLWHPSHFVAFLGELRGGAVVAASLMGDPSPVEVGTDFASEPLLLENCVGWIAWANPGVRLAGFADAFGARGLWRSICDQDLVDQMRAIGDRLASAMRDPCIEDPIDARDWSDTPGLQLGCAVEASGVELPACTMLANGFPATTDTACWWAEVNPHICGDTPSQVLLHVENVPSASEVSARCLPPAAG